MYTDFTSQQMLNDSKENTDWWRGEIIYQIYPRSFNDSDADGVGDLKGITQRLAYISDLGVDAIWICPFYASPMADGGYDVSDYRAVHPMFGTLNDFDVLIQQAHQFKIKVMIDLVLSHTSNQHEWFKQSRKKRKISTLTGMCGLMGNHHQIMKLKTTISQNHLTIGSHYSVVQHGSGLKKRSALLT